EIEGEALATLVINKLRGTFRCAAVKAPGYGDRRKAMLEDIAVLTGGRAIFEDLGIQLENVQLRDLGRAKKVKIDKDNTTIIEGAGKKADIQGRIQLIQRELDKSTSDYDKEKLGERISKLSGGVAKINVGAATESEMKERKARVEDAMHATRAANQAGILPGGGVALLRASQAAKPKGLSHDEKARDKRLLRSCRSGVWSPRHRGGLCLRGAFLRRAFAANHATLRHPGARSSQPALGPDAGGRPGPALLAAGRAAAARGDDYGGPELRPPPSV